MDAGGSAGVPGTPFAYSIRAKNAEKAVIDDSVQTWQDLRQIVLTRSYEVRDWCKAFGCTKEELQDAVQAVGTSAQRVREYLKGDAAARR